MKRSCFFILLFFLLNFLLFASDLEKLNSEFKALSGEDKALFLKSAGMLKCPTCSTLGVLESDTPFSLSIREKVIVLIKEKKTEKEIKDFFVDRYGEWLLRAPPKEGIHLLLWGTPTVFLFVFLCFCVFVFYKSKSVSLRKTQEESFSEMFSADLARFRKRG